MPLTKVDAQLVGGAITTDSSGNVGIGVTPASWSLANYKALQVGNSGLFGGTANGDSNFSSNAYYNSGWNYIVTAGASYYNQNGGSHIWYNAPSGTAGTAITFTERMRIDSSGNLLVGTTSNPLGAKVSFAATWPQTVQAVYCTAAGGHTAIGFANGGTQVGRIDTTSTATSYVTSSDYRLKENIAPMTGALDKVQQLKPVTYSWKINNSSSQGFIAHELAEVCPEAVVGEKDAVDADGNPVYQGIDTSFLVATLTAAIQELKAELDATKAEVAALKAGA